MKDTKRIMDITKGVLDAMLAHDDFKDRVIPEKIPTILSNIETLLNDRDALDRFAEKNFAHKTFTAQNLNNPNFPEHTAMMAGTLYYCPRDNTTYIYGDTVERMSPHDQALVLFWLLRTGADDFLAYIEPAFKDFDNYVLRKSYIAPIIRVNLDFLDPSTMLKESIYEITQMLSKMNLYPLTMLKYTFFVDIEEWFLNNTLLNTQYPSTTVKISEYAMYKAVVYYNTLELNTAISIFNIISNPEVLDILAKNPYTMG